MRISKEGITFNYNNDEITWLWWWVRSTTSALKSFKYRSLVYDIPFSSIADYWRQVGALENEDMKRTVSKIQGFSTRSVIRDWARMNLRRGFWVVMSDINVESKPASFWRTIPEQLRKEMTNDFVILRCKNDIEMNHLCETLDPSFCFAIGIDNGYIANTNNPI